MRKPATLAGSVKRAIYGLRYLKFSPMHESLIEPLAKALKSYEAHDNIALCCPACGWGFTIHAPRGVKKDSAYVGAEWYCPHCGQTVKEN